MKNFSVFYSEYNYIPVLKIVTADVFSLPRWICRILVFFCNCFIFVSFYFLFRNKLWYFLHYMNSKEKSRYFLLLSQTFWLWKKIESRSKPLLSICNIHAKCMCCIYMYRISELFVPLVAGLSWIWASSANLMIFDRLQ